MATKNIDFVHVYFWFFKFFTFYRCMNMKYSNMVTLKFYILSIKWVFAVKKCHKLFCHRVKITLSLNNITFDSNWMKTLYKPITFSSIYCDSSTTSLKIKKFKYFTLMENGSNETESMLRLFFLRRDSFFLVHLNHLNLFPDPFRSDICVCFQ